MVQLLGLDRAQVMYQHQPIDQLGGGYRFLSSAAVKARARFFGAWKMAAFAGWKLIECMTVSAPGGTHQVEIPRFLRNTSSLNDEQVIEMAKLALTLEVTMEHPVDVECAYAGGELYLLQCRPITTLH